MLRRRLYRFLPPLDPAFAGYLYTVFSRDRRDIPRIRYYKRYLKYIPEILTGMIKAAIREK
jgi:hypothetical protein